ncbi:MAG: hypothetical protein WCD86_19570 [Ktedonobacteraceae bacterium]
MQKGAQRHPAAILGNVLPSQAGDILPSRGRDTLSWYARHPASSLAFSLPASPRTNDPQEGSHHVSTIVEDHSQS